MKRIQLTVATIAASMTLANAAWGFGSTIAVGMNQAAGVDAPDTPFRAQAKLETADEKMNMTIYYRPGQTRDEVRMGSQDMVVLQDLAEQKFYMLMPQGMYMEFESGDKNEQMQEYKLVEREIVGKENVNGFETTKYKVIYEGPDGKYGGFSWYTDDNIAVRAFIVSEEKGDKQRVCFQITELERGEQSASLFEIPSNYRKFDMGGFGLDSMMGGGMQQPGETPPPQAPAGYSAPMAAGGDPVVKMVQENLAALGYETGGTDGVVNTETTIAISQFQAERSMEITGKASPQLAGALAAEVGKQQGGGRSFETQGSNADALQAAQEACLREKMEAAQERKKKKRGFGSLLSAAARVATGTGSSALAETTRDIYDANATAEDLSSAAKDLGLTEDEIEACKNPM